ncbi:hypothetical protein [Nocardia sputorum]|uniref:Integral membrane protein n=1 Tax=Nocardia sputorum TaxID=2984338 RepID=A0ABM8CY14_9NOCA|nr:hypothetical protein [Nocardia sputorum]BDT91291.1 hypothetical protein IFM12275_12670 [Nocardia sputorum]BDT99925.1 hypothetical protein IFM12276_29540 [Nocardia sputorum]
MPTGIRSTTRTLARFAAGGLLVNTVPHAVKGLAGERFPTPFANPPGVGLSSPTANVAWGAINLVIGSALLRGGLRTTGEKVATGAGGALMAFGLSYYFGRLDHTNRGPTTPFLAAPDT